MRRTVRGVALASVALLVSAPVYALATPSPSEADGSAAAKTLLAQDRAYYHTDVAPAVAEPAESDEQLGAVRGRRRPEAAEGGERSTGFPPAARELARREALASTRNISPRRSARATGAAAVQRAKLLTLLVEFNPQANDDFSGFERPNDPAFPTGCVTEPAGTLLNGPLHNQLPDPAMIGRRTDNNTFWVPDFSRDHYRKLIYSTDGLTQKVRPDLGGGIDVRGRTVANLYREMSKGRYLLEGEVSPWLRLPHSEGWYSADSCAAGARSDVGHPDNPRGTGQMAIDAVAALAAADGDFPWGDYDIEDQADRDDDGNLYEPDGALDHVVVLHAGADQAAGGGAEGSYAEWSSSSVVGATTGGIAVPGADGLRVFNYTTQPENAGIGVIAHEYGHDLGLPDLYNSVGTPDTDVGWWDLMSTGSHGGELQQILPTHLGAWSKYVLGWVEPTVLEYGSDRAAMVLGQASRPPKGTEPAVKINLPTKHVQVGRPHGGSWAWWSSSDQSWADVRLTRTVEVPTGTDVRFWSWNDYAIEEYWDYGFVEVSTDGGSSWSQLEVFDESGALVSTDEDPHGNMGGQFGGLENGLTGDTDGYRHDYVNLTPYAGSTVQLRLRYLTDAAFQRRGWFADDFSITVDGTAVFTDDVEDGANGWTAQASALAPTSGAGWVRTTGEFDYDQYYLAEWRNFDGYDNGLRTPYATRYRVNGEWNVLRTPYNAPGLLIWYRDASHSVNDLGNNLYDPPSIGAKGTVLLVDAHYEPARLSGAAAAANPSLLDNLNSRQQASDVAFGRVGRYPFSYCYPTSATDPYAVACNRFGRRAPVTRFSDAVGWYPGVEYRPDLNADQPFFLRDAGASTVVPSIGNTLYSTRVVDANGRLVEDLVGRPVEQGHVLGTGNPQDGRPAVAGGDPGTTADLSLGVRIRVLAPQRKNTAASVVVWPGHQGGSAALARTGQR